MTFRVAMIGALLGAIGNFIIAKSSGFPMDIALFVALAISDGFLVWVLLFGVIELLDRRLSRRHDLSAYDCGTSLVNYIRGNRS
jgi:hypothetical protein